MHLYRTKHTFANPTLRVLNAGGSSPSFRREPILLITFPNSSLPLYHIFPAFYLYAAPFSTPFVVLFPTLSIYLHLSSIPCMPSLTYINGVLETNYINRAAEYRVSCDAGKIVPYTN